MSACPDTDTLNFCLDLLTCFGLQRCPAGPVLRVGKHPVKITARYR